jgi:DNA gyrase subunit A
MAVRFDECKVRPMGRAAHGVKGVTLKNEGDRIVGCEVVNGDEAVLVVCENGFGKRSPVSGYRQTNRGGVGVRSIVTSERNGNVVGALCASDNDGLLMMSATGQTVRINMRDLRIMGRNTQGVKLAQLRDGDTLIALQKLENAAQENLEEESPGGALPLPADHVLDEGDLPDVVDEAVDLSEEALNGDSYVDNDIEEENDDIEPGN